ncbi:alpha/beta fold hydrolase [Kitasatospora sp. NPDC086801]|uniref:alpha/beta fold hydrolase n=1 Tax=Kitasatospora sp. NPDC086801 TaxID=3364066 RepID=UPI0038265BD5
MAGELRAGGQRVVAVDQRGRGASERRPEGVSRAAYVADVAAVARELGLERPVLVGQSTGGSTAGRCSADRRGFLPVRGSADSLACGPAGPSARWRAVLLAGRPEGSAERVQPGAEPVALAGHQPGVAQGVRQ